VSGHVTSSMILLSARTRSLGEYLAITQLSGATWLAL